MCYGPAVKNMGVDGDKELRNMKCDFFAKVVSENDIISMPTHQCVEPGSLLDNVSERAIVPADVVSV